MFSTELDLCLGVLSVRVYLVFPGRSRGKVLPDLSSLPLLAAGGAVVSAALSGVNVRLSRLFPFVRRTSSTSFSRSSVSV